MAFVKTPSVLFGSNYNYQSDTIELDRTEYANISAGEADASTGDYRRIMYGLLEDCYARFMAQAVANRPARMTFVKNTSVNDTVGNAQVTYTIRFTVDNVIAEVSDEPV